MAGPGINYDRGVIKRIHAPTGVAIFMYVDEPGAYRNAFGTEVAETLAAQAGFDTTQLRRERLKRERMAEAMRKIEAELADPASPTLEVVAERGGFKLVHLGLGRHNVLDPEGNKLNSVQLPKEEGIKLIEHLAPGEETTFPARDDDAA